MLIGNAKSETLQAYDSTFHSYLSTILRCGVKEHPQRVEDTLWIVCVGDAPIVVNPTLSVGDV
ncbi:MAG: hypothetical protein ACI31D_06535 [Candidatus Limisoma sp.]